MDFLSKYKVDSDSWHLHVAHIKVPFENLTLGNKLEVEEVLLNNIESTDYNKVM